MELAVRDWLKQAGVVVIIGLSALWTVSYSIQKSTEGFHAIRDTFSGIGSVIGWVTGSRSTGSTAQSDYSAPTAAMPQRVSQPVPRLTLEQLIDVRINNTPLPTEIMDRVTLVALHRDGKVLLHSVNLNTSVPTNRRDQMTRELRGVWLKWSCTDASHREYLSGGYTMAWRMFDNAGWTMQFRYAERDCVQAKYTVN
jgi:hypothetical protein